MDEAKSMLYSFDNIAKSHKSTHNVVGSDNQQLIIDNVLNVNLRGMTLKSFISHRLPLLDLPVEVTDAIMGGLEYTKAVAIAKIEDPEQRADLLRSAIETEMPLTEIKKQVKSLMPTTQKQEPKPQDRVRSTMKTVISSKVWENTEKWCELNSLLDRIDALLHQEPPPDLIIDEKPE